MSDDNPGDLFRAFMRDAHRSADDQTQTLIALVEELLSNRELLVGLIVAKLEGDPGRETKEEMLRRNDMALDVIVEFFTEEPDHE